MFCEYFVDWRLLATDGQDISRLQLNLEKRIMFSLVPCQNHLNLIMNWSQLEKYTHGFLSLDVLRKFSVRLKVLFWINIDPLK